MGRYRITVFGLVLLLSGLAGCSSGGGNNNADSSGGGNTVPPGGGDTALVGPPPPVIVDESGAPQRLSSARIAFTNVALVTMENDAITPAQTVVVSDGLISAIGPSNAMTVPADAAVIDGSGRFLMPGLADMHIHPIVGSNQDGERDLLLQLAAGVTTARIMWGNPAHLDWRQRIRNGTLTGPRLYVASPGLEGDPAYWPGSVVVANEVEARAAVRAQHTAGYDFVKVYNQVQLDLYDVIVAEAEVLGIPVIGHVPRAMSANYAVSAGQQTIEHFSGFASHATTTGGWSGSIDNGKLAGLIEQIRLQGTWNCPTLTVRSRSASQVAALRANPAFARVSPSMQSWLDDDLTQPPAFDRSTEVRLLGEVVKALQDADVGLLVGTDAGVQYVYPGFSIHEELARFVAAGLTPYQTLRAATVNAAAALGETDRAGTIAVGKRADLLLLDANPLVDVGNVNRRVGVMSAGEWFTQSSLMALVDAN